MAHKILRTFHPVGHGAFYSEKHFFDEKSEERSFSVVYDCGALRDVGLVESVIDRVFRPGEKIAAVYLSHFDDDHVNGLPHLLGRCDIGEVFFPLITNSSLVIHYAISSLLRNAGGRPPVCYQLLQRLTKGLLPQIYDLEDREWMRRTKFVGILPYGEDEEGNNLANNFWDCQRVASGQSLILKQVGGTAYDIPPWKYVPFNLMRLNRRGAQISVSYPYHVLAWLFPSLGPDLLKPCLSQLAREFADATKLGGRTEHLNHFSLTMFSGPVEKEFPRLRTSRSPDIGNGQQEYKSGCLYTGDYHAGGRGQFRAEQLYQAYSRFWDDIGCVQLPHHGSTDNFRDKLLIPGACFVASVKGNDPAHPGREVRNKISVNGQDLYCVTENTNFELVFKN